MTQALLVLDPFIYGNRTCRACTVRQVSEGTRTSYACGGGSLSDHLAAHGIQVRHVGTEGAREA